MVKRTSRRLYQENSERASEACLFFLLFPTLKEYISYVVCMMYHICDMYTIYIYIYITPSHSLTFLALNEQCFLPSMERPPPFKPPPPPIKYTCIQESIGSDLPCHEMETL